MCNVASAKLSDVLEAKHRLGTLLFLLIQNVLVLRSYWYHNIIHMFFVKSLYNGGIQYVPDLMEKSTPEEPETKSPPPQIRR